MKSGYMDNGKIVMKLENYRIGDVGQFTSLPPNAGYQGQREVLYDIKTGKYTVLKGSGVGYGYMNSKILADIESSYLDKDGRMIGHLLQILIEPYKESYRYSVAYHHENNDTVMDTHPYITDNWTVMSVSHWDGVDYPRSLLYAKTGEWKWTTLAYGVTGGKAIEITISGNNALFYHYGTNATWLCDLSKNPQKVEECKKVGSEGEVAGFPRFDRDNPNRVIYRSMREGGSNNRYVILDISQNPWKIEKEFDIPPTESPSSSIQLQQVRSNVMLYLEGYVLNASGTDNKLCFYRMDTGKVYCSKLIEGSDNYDHFHASFEGKYLFWQVGYGQGYILRDMECYCEKFGVCPYEGMNGFPSIGVGN